RRGALTRCFAFTEAHLCHSLSGPRGPPHAGAGELMRCDLLYSNQLNYRYPVYRTATSWAKRASTTWTSRDGVMRCQPRSSGRVICVRMYGPTLCNFAMGRTI